MHALYPPTPSPLTTINETREIHILQFHPHAFPYNPILPQLYMQETDYQLQIPALDYTKDHLYSRITKAINTYDFWFKKKFNFMHLQFNFIKPNNFEFLNRASSNCSFEQILSSKKLHHYSHENFYTQHTLHTNKKHKFVYNKFSSPYSPSAKYALDSSYLHGHIRNSGTLEDYFSYYSEANTNQPPIVPHETLSTHDPHFYVYDNQPPPPLTTHFSTLTSPNQSLQHRFTFIIVY